ncbi:putative disease resistance protein At1g50180 [Coffea arabica]|uniref:Disease resistance protein At1g50180 n=1 Tax=Coffea arabica TaxID=13443 RepID=A0A6P6WMI3_COFAR
MTEAILLSSVKSIGKLLIDEGNFLRGVTDQVKLLHEDLKRMQWFLKHVAAKQSDRECVQLWISEFRAIACEANDLVEDYALRVSIQRKQGFWHTLKRHVGFFKQGYAKHKLSSEIQSLRTRISNLTKNFSEYGVRAVIEEEGSSSMVMEQQLRRTFSFVVEEDIVGIQRDVEMLVKYLLNGNEAGHHSVVSIYGMGGLGKTTLAKRVYHHPKLKKQFAGFAWVCVSQQWQTKDLLQGMLVKLSPEQRSDVMHGTEGELAKRLHQVLQDRRCLIVLDDIWSPDAWNCIKYALPITEEGSKILLTTRNREVASYVGPNGYHHQPPFLNEEQSWELLQRKSLIGKSSQGCEDLDKIEELGKKMLKHCGGLPLAVVVLGGILKTKKSLSEWRVVHDNIKSYLERGENFGKVGEVPKILAFSYYDLPYQLKPCFLYLGKFKEDSNIEAEWLYQLWMAEGMILENDRIGQETMMDVAERYLEELAKRCMVQVKLHEEGKPAVTRFKSCRIHDLMRDLCLLKAEEQNLYKVVDSQHDQDIFVTSVDISHAIEEEYFGFVLRLCAVDFQHNYVPLRKEQTKHLHSYMYEPLDCSGDNYGRRLGRKIMSEVNNLKMLRVLAIENSSLASRSCYSRSPLECIGNLIHLRCLRLRDCHGLKLPSCLGNLKYLETLDLRGSYCSRLPNVLSKLGRLRHLYLPCCSGKQRLDGLSKQLEILESFDSTLYFHPNLSRLTNLRALKAMVIENLGDLEEIINHITNLNYLRMTSLEVWDCINSNSNKGLAVLEQMLFCKNIHELQIVGASLCKQLPIYRPHQSSPRPGLTELTLRFSDIEEDPMATLEKLPNLRRLHLHEHSFVGTEMTCHALGFPQLEVLELICLYNLERWKVHEGAMPKLSSLLISYCEKLEMVPNGLRSITTLERICFFGMPEEFLERVQTVNGEQAPDYNKIRHVPSVVIR